MERDIIRIYTEQMEYSYDDITIEEFLELGQRNKEKGATNVEIETNPDDTEVKIDFYYEREENDDEYNERVERVRKNNELSRDYKLRKYEELKKELGL